jgi:transposase
LPVAGSAAHTLPTAVPCLVTMRASVWPAEVNACPWRARQAPQVASSAGKRKGKNATGRGNPYIGGTLGEAAVNAGRTQTFLGTKYRRLVRHMPKKKAQGAVSRTQLVITHALLSDPEAEYTDLGTGYYEQKADIRHRARNHVRGLERLGYKVTIEALSPDPETGELLPVTKAR